MIVIMKLFFPDAADKHTWHLSSFSENRLQEAVKSFCRGLMKDFIVISCRGL